MTQNQELLKIGPFAKLAGTNLRTLRYYEELGLLEPAERSDGGFRLYRSADKHRVQLIRDLQSLGLQLEAIRDLLGGRDEPQPREVWLARLNRCLEEHRTLIDAKIEALTEQRAKIDQAAGKLADCATCVHRPGPENNFCEPCTNTGLSLPDFLHGLF